MLKDSYKFNSGILYFNYFKSIQVKSAATINITGGFKELTNSKVINELEDYLRNTQLFTVVLRI